MLRSAAVIVAFTLLTSLACRDAGIGITAFDQVIPIPVGDEFWTTPSGDSFILLFPLSPDVKPDSQLAGAIQYRLEKARTASPELADFHPLPDWVLGELFLEVDDSLFQRYDPQTSSFVYEPLDSLLSLYPPDSSQKIQYSHSSYVKFYFPTDHNVGLLSDMFGKIAGVASAWTNGLAWVPENCLRDIDLTIDQRAYYFTFSQHGVLCNGQKEWGVRVIDDEVTLISSRDF